MSAYDRASRQLRNRQPGLPDFRIPQHGHTSPRDGGALGDAYSAGGGSGSSGGSSTPGLSTVTDGTHTVASPVSIDFTSGATVTDLGGGVAGVAIAGSGFELNTEGGQSVIKAHGSMGATETFDPTDGNVHTGTLDADCTFTLSAPAGSGACTLELRLSQDGTGGRTITWPGSVTVVGTLDTTASTTSAVILETLDGGTSWTAWVVGSGGASFASPTIALGTAASAGAATTTIRSDATIVAFDATAPTTAALGDSAATGSAAYAARRDHRHGMPALSTATPLADSGAGSVGTGTLSSREDHVHPASSSGGHILLSDTRSTPFSFNDLLQMDDGSDFMWSD